MRQTYFLTLFASEVRSSFPFLSKIKAGTAQKAAIALCGALMSPLILYRSAVEFRIPYIEIVITPRCNLSCKGCANLMPQYNGSSNQDVELVKKSLDALFSVSKKISEMTIIGGEPFMHPKMHEILDYAYNSGQVIKFKVTTNGGIVPRGENLESLKKQNLLVSISEYPVVDRSKIIDELEKNGINYEVNHFDEWTDYGGTEKRNLSLEGLRKSFARCASAKCKSIFNGQLFACPRSAHGNALGVIPHQSTESVDLLKLEKKELKREIKALYGKDYINACDHCNPVWQRKEIPCGEQE